eukprot:g41451.t1
MALPHFGVSGRVRSRPQADSPSPEPQARLRLHVHDYARVPEEAVTSAKGMVEIADDQPLRLEDHRMGNRRLIALNVLTFQVLIQVLFKDWEQLLSIHPVHVPHNLTHLNQVLPQLSLFQRKQPKPIQSLFIAEILHP